MNPLNAILRRLGSQTPTGSRQKSLRQRVGEQGYPNLSYDEEAEAREAIQRVDAYTLLSYERLVTLWQQVRYLDRADLPGCLVECGTWRGGAIGMMALAHLASGKASRSLHLFDSFEGLPEPDAQKDGPAGIVYANGQANGALKSIGQCVGPLEDNQHLIEKIVEYPTPLVHYHIGWFQDTVPEAAAVIEPIALLRLDGDWYESTRICLETLYPKVVSGGIVVIDDYGKFSGCRQAVDEFMATLDRPLFLNHIDPPGRYFIVP